MEKEKLNLVGEWGKYPYHFSFLIKALNKPIVWEIKIISGVEGVQPEFILFEYPKGFNGEALFLKKKKHFGRLYFDLKKTILERFDIAKWKSNW